VNLLARKVDRFVSDIPPSPAVRKARRKRDISQLQDPAPARVFRRDAACSEIGRLRG
jgi:hypothetical protein